jgi:cyclopropane fatty-acyl-phospholipid synthase-like methyltransferase
MQKPFSPACERNRDPILKELQIRLVQQSTVLEVGSGTGQHAIYFAKHMPNISWQCSDLRENLSGIQMWIDDACLSNVLQPIELDVSDPTICKTYDAVYSCNTLHIMSKSNVVEFFKLVKSVTQEQSSLFVYGPFNYNGEYTSSSNAEFDAWLKERNLTSAIRDFEWIDELANDVGFSIVDDVEMPANNRLLHWERCKE